MYIRRSYLFVSVFHKGFGVFMTHRFSFLNYAALHLTLCILLFHVLELCKYESFSMAFLYFIVLVNRLQGQFTPMFLNMPIIGIPTWKLCTFVLQSHMICDVFIFFCSLISYKDVSLPFVIQSSDGELSLNKEMCPYCTEL